MIVNGNSKRAEPESHFHLSIYIFLLRNCQFSFDRQDEILKLTNDFQFVDNGDATGLNCDWEKPEINPYFFKNHR